MTIFRCHECGSTEAGEEFIAEVFMIDGKPILVENIPALVCNHCGDATISRQTTERVRRIVHGESQPVGTVEMDIFTYEP